MRIVVIALAALAALATVAATGGEATGKTRPAATRKAAPAAPAQTKAPAPGSPRAVYAAMPEAERKAIQADLIWTGDYNGLIDTDFGDNSVAAVKTFQKRNGGKETGLLNPDERSKLADSARIKRQNAGWRVVDDQVTGARLGVPGKFVPRRRRPAAGPTGNPRAARCRSRPSGQAGRLSRPRSTRPRSSRPTARSSIT